MLTNSKLVWKLENLLPHYRALRYRHIAEIAVEVFETKDHLRREPGDDVPWRPIAPGERWGGSWITGWFRGDVTVPAEAEGLPLLVSTHLGLEGLLFVNGRPVGVMNAQHKHTQAAAKAKSGERMHIAVEAYSGHNFPNMFPNHEPIVIKELEFQGIHLSIERQDVSAFVFDLEVLLGLEKSLDADSLRKNDLHRDLEKVWAAIHALPGETTESDWRPRLQKARAIMAPLLAQKNPERAPTVAITAHSHLDTAWLWPLAETERKCARTFSTVVNLMDQYPETIFIQSAPYHAAVVKRDYPELYAEMHRLYKEGRWEPNGGAWIEPDCNIPSGESLVRQFLIGINWTREEFGYSPDTFWQPDVFGYSAALPQILRSFNIEFFCTTKMSWNDTTRFPYDVFTWRGLDGTSVLAHLNHHVHGFLATDPARIWKSTNHKDTEDRHLLAWGHGDGGGGPDMEGMEYIRRMRDLEGIPRVQYTTVSDFMISLRDRERPHPEFVGELYLELHRGTLTSIAAVKKLNRAFEFAAQEAELACTMAAIAGHDYPAASLLDIWKEGLVNQFHDIIPGTSIQRVNEEAVASYTDLIDRLHGLTEQGVRQVAGAASGNSQLLMNVLNWERSDDLSLTGVPAGRRPAAEGVVCQRIADLDGVESLIAAGLHVPALGFARVDFANGEEDSGSPFRLKGDTLETPHWCVRFDKDGVIHSAVYTPCDREIIREGGSLNEFLCGEDIPAVWDNWDIDSDQELKMAPERRLVSRTIVADGPLQFRIRQEIAIGSSSHLTQDIVFHANSPRIDFDTRVDWKETHKLLKTGFDLDILAETARHEIQYGHVERPRHRNYPQDAARFEVVNHKWTDVSDNGFGITILNDCKYGISTQCGRFALSLIKGGTHPDERADQGRHRFRYALLPHEGAFSVASVVRPAYEFNVAPFAASVASDTAIPKPLATICGDNVIVGAIKWAEQDKAYVVRLYEAGKTLQRVSIKPNTVYTRVAEVNLLEEEIASATLADGGVQLTMKPFQIRTVKFWIR